MTRLSKRAQHGFGNGSARRFGGKPVKFSFLITTRKLIVFSMVFFFSISSFAQAPALPPAAAGSVEKGKNIAGPRKQLATIIFAGLGGAILGLSTLSFYGRPQDNLRNIAIGTAFGVIGGTILVTFKAATNPAELYGEQRQMEQYFEANSGRQFGQYASAAEPPLEFRFNFEF